MASSVLLLAQMEALRGVWLTTAAGKAFALLHARTKQTPAVKVADARRKNRAARDYLDDTVVLPLGAPLPEVMREAKKRPVSNPRLWAEHAPASGCREIRNATGTRAVSSGGAGWGGPDRAYFSQTTDDRLDAMEWTVFWRACHSPLPTD